MKAHVASVVERAKQAAVEVLLHNAHGPCRGLPRTAAWGYPEPYTRDLMICTFGVLVSGNEDLIARHRKVLTTLASHQSPRGHIPSLVHDSEDRGASDTTPLFILATSIFAESISEPGFLSEHVDRARTWMAYQSPDDRLLVTQLPTSDWRDEQWVIGYGLYVNTLVYSYLRFLGAEVEAETVRELMTKFTVRGSSQQRHVHEGLRMPDKPYFAMWSYKVFNSERFDLLGNSLAVLAGIASKHRALQLIHWIESECEALIDRGELAIDLPPALFPYIREGEPDWRTRYADYNQPGEYHNGGMWPFLCGFYVACLVAAGKQRLAEQRLESLTRLITVARDGDLEFGFNEWIKAQDGSPRGQDWQSWSAAMYLYAAACVETSRTPFFDVIRAGRGATILDTR